MSYRSDMEAFAREAQKRKKLVGWVLKITILVLAATVLVAAVGIGITLAQGGFGGDDESGDDTKKPVSNSGWRKAMLNVALCLF